MDVCVVSENPDLLAVLERGNPNNHLADVFGVARVTTEAGPMEEGGVGVSLHGGGTTRATIKFRITPSDQAKCPRCWKFQSGAEDSLCHRCTETVNGP
mmetsp:Transcript_27839/g.77878  ORF Transcript_27839/g.77878 Transcript_27839/m.77878 type:complete len:98 (+) Transcript_27839:885-1178(+)